MAKKISQLTQATEVKSDDVTVIVQDGETKKLPLNMMVTKQDIENKKVAGLAKLDEIEATYENDTYTPTITVKNKSSVKTGEGDEVDYSANVMDGHAKSAILKGSTKYRDIDTGEVLDVFEDGRNLELVSVRMPVLTTTGKNLFDENKKIAGYIAGNSINENLQTDIKNTWTTYWIKAKPNTKYIISGGNRCRWQIKSISGVITYKETEIITTLSDTEYIRCYYCSRDYTASNVQIEEGSVATSYEPYKSNILSCNEEVTLRGIGDVKDTLDCLTGEVTERIGEIVLDGNSTFSSVTTQQNGIRIQYNNANKKRGTNIPVISNKFNFVSYSNTNIPFTVFCGNNSDIYFMLPLNSNVTSIADAKNWFNENNTIIQFPLTTEIVKTVDLMPSGTHPSTTPYCWKNGHIQLSSSGLLPNLEYSVVTSRAGQINQNATMIVKNDKRIFDLEILLAGGLVNTTYQALTLQNQVETGLSKVSLNSETEPDYLLYHMIMKLIEEKAYKLDDLTEKVSVFYLYEKLSDEQFETIYSALYPFAEDEIIEEPVVEELPEVVEDEVIM